MSDTVFNNDFFRNDMRTSFTPKHLQYGIKGHVRTKHAAIVSDKNSMTQSIEDFIWLLILLAIAFLLGYMISYMKMTQPSKTKDAATQTGNDLALSGALADAKAENAEIKRRCAADRAFAETRIRTLKRQGKVKIVNEAEWRRKYYAQVQGIFRMQCNYRDIEIEQASRIGSLERELSAHVRTIQYLKSQRNPPEGHREKEIEAMKRDHSNELARLMVTNQQSIDNLNQTHKLEIHRLTERLAEESRNTQAVQQERQQRTEADLNQRLLKLEQEKAQLSSGKGAEIDDLLKQLKEAARESDHKSNEINRLRELVNEAQAESGEKTNRINQLSMECQKANDRVIMLEGNSQELQQNLIIATDRLAHVEQELATVARDLESLKVAYAQLQTHCQQLEAQNAEDNNEMEVDSQQERLKQMLANAEAEKDALVLENQGLKKALQDVSSQPIPEAKLSEIEDKIRASTDSAFRDERGGLQAMVRDKDAEIQKLKATPSKTSGALSLDEELKKQMKQASLNQRALHAQSGTEANEKIKSLQNELRMAKLSNSKLSKNVKQLKADYDRLKETLKGKNPDFAADREKSEKLINDLRAEIASLEEKIAALETQVEEAKKAAEKAAKASKKPLPFDPVPEASGVKRGRGDDDEEMGDSGEDPEQKKQKVKPAEPGDVK